MARKLFLLFACIYGWAIILQAQEITNHRILNQASLGYKLAFDNNYAKALTLAKTKGWPLTVKSADGRRGVLVGVDRFGFPQYYINFNNTIAAATTRANQLWPGGTSGLNLSGSSDNMKNKIAVWDESNVLRTHVELVGRVTQKDNPTATSDHATHTSGTMIASGVNPAAKGMAFGAQGLIAYDYSNDVSEMSAEAQNLLISNHSYGITAGWEFNSDQNRWEFNGTPGSTEDYKFGNYNDYIQNIDSIAYNAPFFLSVYAAGNYRSTGSRGPAVGQPYFRRNANGVMVAAGNRPDGISSNDGYDILTHGAIAKNTLTVGAVNGIPAGYGKKEDVVLSSFSSWGPTDDGRIKPDVVADGVNVLSSVATGNNSYASLSGTSMAAPNAAGSLFLLQEYYSKLKNGAFLRSATVRGLAIHTADEAGPTPGPDYQYGWGLLDVEKAAAVITAAVPAANSATSAHLLYENSLTNGQTYTTTVIASGKGVLTATICWTDVKGLVDTSTVPNNRTKKLVNDLDIRITKGSGAALRTYLPWTLDVSVPAAAAVPGDNVTDNVERIDIDSTVPGQSYTITVKHKGTLARGSQAYSLLVSGVGGAAYCASTSGGGGARIDSVSFQSIHVANPVGSRTYSDYTANMADIEAFQTIPITVKVGTADATTNGRIVKVFIDFNNNGVFDTGELLATSGVLSSTSQLYTTNIAIPAGLTVGNISLMRIVVQETSNAADVLPCGTYAKGETQDYRVRVVGASNDMGISEITSPSGGSCASGAAYLTVRLRNAGTVMQSNIPISAVVTTASGTIATLSAVYPGNIAGLSSAYYTFQVPFATNAGATYTISATTNLVTDQNTANNQLVSTFAIAAKATVPAATGEICGTTALLKVDNADANFTYFWYNSATATAPIASGTTATTTTIPTDKTFYVAKEAKASVGPVNKLVFPSGGYNTFAGNYVKINNSVPVVLETVKLYVGNPGQVRITLANLVSEDATTGGYTYNQLATTTLDVFASNPNPAPGAVTGNPTADEGAVYYLNLPVNNTGDHILIVECLKGVGRSDSASLFRNNGISATTTYPMSLPGIISITGNSAHTSGAVESQFYYFFYDMRVSTTSCGSDRVAVVAATAPTPVITQQADSLVSSIAVGNQWYLNDTAINGATGKNYKPARAGRYKTTVSDGFGCQQTSNVITYTVTAIADVLAEEIKLQVSPNPNNGIFNLSFEVKSRADLTIDILNSAGRKVYTSSIPDFTGKYSKQITVNSLSAELYLLKIQHDKKTYVKKILIQQ